ncbi:MAG: hypothetical protein HYW48_00630 [Deltaproteobacteria bacterium]|nr:hypothetical protein [Deltaproteobacteria bacterium]
MLDKLKELFRSLREKNWFAQKQTFFFNLLIIFLISYLAAETVSSSVLPTLLNSVLKAKPAIDKVEFSVAEARSRVNYHEVRKVVLERNFFNKTGELPEESDLQKEDSSLAKFNIEAPCEKTLLKVKLLGTIFLGGETPSLATIKEDGYETADIYTIGDFIIGGESAQVVEIRRNEVIINNLGRKECLELAVGEAKRVGMVKAPKAGDEIKTVEFESAWVEEQLGDGFGKIIQAARLVPNTENNRVNGFKIFAINKDSLFDKAGFKDGDVITQVNDVVMEAEQGFALYQALLDERDIRVNVLSEGKTPRTILIKIK